MFAATIVISALNAHWVRNILMEKSEEYASLLVENLNHQIFLRFIVPAAIKYREIKLREKEQSDWLDQVVRSTLHSFNVEMVNIYDMNNVISYSYDRSRIGLEDAGGVSYQKAIKKEATSRLVRTGNFWELFFWYPEETKIVTFAPLRAEKGSNAPLGGPVLGVVEIVRDVTDDYKQIFKLQGLIIASCFVVMGILFIVLRFVVKQGETIIERRAEERLRLEEKLRHAEHLSTIGEMTAGVSHEIRNPLGIIKSSSELLKNKMIRLDADPTIAEIIIEESHRLDNIIRDFLDFAKPRNPDFRPCRVGDVIDKNLLFLSSQIEAQNIQVIRHLDDSLPEIEADSAMLYQAFLNIFINAFQAMPDGGELTVRGKYENSRLVLNFMDQGEGVPEREMKKIWSPFFTTKDTGTGLGLGIVKNIIEAHHGSITIANRESGGVDVCITLPVMENMAWKKY